MLDAFKKELGIDVGGTTEDREFSLEIARCFGACGLAPVITVDDDVHHRVKPKRIGEILAQYSARGRAPTRRGSAGADMAEKITEPGPAQGAAPPRRRPASTCATAARRRR